MPTTKPKMHERLWRAMRIMRSFTLDKLTAATESSRHEAGIYVHLLRRSGFVNFQGARRRTGTRFLLVRDSGPKQPKVLYRRDDATGRMLKVGVYDRNTDKGYGLDGGEAPSLVQPAPIVDPKPRHPRRKKVAP